MHSFSIAPSAIRMVIEGLLCEQLNREDHKLRVQLGNVEWNEELRFDDKGIELDSESLSTSRKTVAQFFGLSVDPNGALSVEKSLGEWSEHISQALKDEMNHFNFWPAGREDNTPIRHRVDSLFQDAAAAASLLQGRRRVVSLVSPHNLLGFILTVLTPALQGIETIDARRSSPDELADLLAFGDVIVATPSLWAYMVREGLQAPDNTMGVSFGEAMPREVSADMRRQGIGVLREFYGSTQTALVGWRDSSTDTFILFDFWSRSEDNLCRTLPDGRHINVTPMDHLKWQTERSFDLSGRRDGAVQIGAINVFPQWIADIIAGHDYVEKCTISVSTSQIGVNRLIADITLNEGLQPTEAVARSVDTHARTNLAVHERPHIYNFF